MVDGNGTLPLAMTVSISNHTGGPVLFEKGAKWRARVGGEWIELERQFNLGSIGATRDTQVLLLVPAGTDSCQLTTRYQWLASEIWKLRLVNAIGLRGRIWLVKHPWLVKRIWPDQWRSKPTASGLKSATLEIQMPGVNASLP